MCRVFAGRVRDGGAVAPFLADDWNPWEEEQVEYNSALNKKRDAFRQFLGQIDKTKSKRYKVQIWGKAAIGKSCYSFYIYQTLRQVLQMQVCVVILNFRHTT